MNTTKIPAGRYMPLTQYARERGMSYVSLRYRLLNGTIRKTYYRVGRAWLIKA